METNLKKARMLAGISQSELAKLSGVSIKTIQAYESGARDINKASVSTATDLANALLCEIKDIL